MFQKHHSSIVDSRDGKKAKDVTVRRSDRRRWRQTALQSFVGACRENEEEEEDTIDPLQRVLHHAWEQGSLMQRTLHVASGGRGVSLWFRSPEEPPNAGNVVEDDVLLGWPYTRASQCIWLQIPDDEAIRGSRTSTTTSQQQQQHHQIPGLALLAVLLAGGWQFPNIVEIHPPVTSYLCRGANVMRAGMLRISLQQQPHSAVVAVCARGNPQPMAVGILHPDLRKLFHNNKSLPNGVIGPGSQGIGVTIVHCYGDDLWKQQQQQASTGGSSRRAGEKILNRVGGAPFDHGHYGNVGFVEGKYVVPIDHPSTEKVDETSTTANSVTTFDTVDGCGDKTNGGDTTKLDSATAVTLPPTNTETNVTNGESDAAISDPRDENETTPVMSPEDVLHAAVCRALVQLNPKNDLPMTMATFYAQHVIPNRPPNTTIQLKQTRYKKWNVYVAEQTQAGLLMVGAAGSKNTQDPLLTGFDRKHDDLRPYLDEQNAAVPDTNDTTTPRRLVLVNLYVVPHHWVSQLRLDRDTVRAVHATSAERQGTGLLTLPEVRQIVQDYITREELVQANVVQLDGPLTDVLYSSKKKQNKKVSDDPSIPPPTVLSHSDLMKQFQAGLESAYALVQMPGNVIVRLGRGIPPQVTIEVTRRQSNKFVTTVRGLEVFGVDPVALAKNVGQRFACASSVESPPTRTSGGGGTTLIQFQGNLANELEALLLGDESLTNHGGAKGSTYHLPKNSIDVVLRKGVPARKKNRGGGTTKTTKP